MNSPIFISGIGTGIGKTVVSAIVTEALEADYWKPVQAGDDYPSDRDWVGMSLTNIKSKLHPEAFSLKMPASPHLAARKENIEITVQKICEHIPDYNCNLIVEGAGGFLVPLNDKEFIRDLIKALGAKLILVNRAYLGSINHSLLTAEVCRNSGIQVLGWIFNSCEPAYENEIAAWTGLPKIGSIPHAEYPGKSFVKEMADSLKGPLIKLLC